MLKVSHHPDTLRFINHRLNDRLAGSDKQVRWAEQVRDRSISAAIPALDAANAAVTAALAIEDLPARRVAIRPHNARREAIEQVLNHREASWWIDARAYSLDDLVAEQVSDWYHARLAAED